MNLVISTTVGWNMGDQIILEGVKHLLSLAWGDPLYYVYHDRNPMKLPSGGDEAHMAIRCGWADALVIAGSPGWTLECNEIYRTALEHKTPIYVIGIGTGVDAGYLTTQVLENADIIQALGQAKLVICRDEIARDETAKHAQKVHLLPCPAVANGLWNGFGWERENRVALGEYYHGGWGTADGVAHQVADLGKSDGQAFYSSSVVDYLAIYKGADDVLSSRLHASVLRRAFSMPVTNLWPASDYRCTATWATLEQGMRAGLHAVVRQYVDLLKAQTPQT